MSDYIEPHDVVDPALVDTLAADMLTRGWAGPEIVVNGVFAITGTHRLAAVRKLRREGRADIEIPTVEVAKLCDDAGVDWDEIVATAPNEAAALLALADVLPAEVVARYGIDIH